MKLKRSILILSALDGDESSVPRPGRFSSRKWASHWTGCRVGPVTGPEVVCCVFVHTTRSTRLMWKRYPAATVYCVVLRGWYDVGAVAHRRIVTIVTHFTSDLQTLPVAARPYVRANVNIRRGISHVRIICGIIISSLQKNSSVELVIILRTNFTWIMFENPVLPGAETLHLHY